MFRDPYDWVEAMRERPHHAHDHMSLEWRDFVTKPWVGKRGKDDAELVKNATKAALTKVGIYNATKSVERAETSTAGGEIDIRIQPNLCIDRYTFSEIVPCSEADSPTKLGYGNYKYELKHDGSEKPYSSIVDLRREKILNHLSVADFLGTRAFLPFRYEDLTGNGTKALLSQVESVTGFTARCNATTATGAMKHKNVSKEYVQWMNKYVDWEVEKLIGYVRR